MSNNNDTYYIRRVLEGHSSDYSFLIDKYKDMVFSLALKITGNREDAEETAQDIFVKAYHGLPRFRATSKFSTWLYSIAYHHAISVTRKKKTNWISMDSQNSMLVENYGEEDSSMMAIEDIPAELAKKALEQLESTDQVLLTLFYREETPVKELSKITGLSIANVKIRLFRGRKKLWAELEKIFKNELVDLL